MNRSAAPFRLSHRALLTGAWLGLLTVSTGLVLSGCAGGNPYPSGSYERAQYYLEKDKKIEAVAALESFVRQNPTDSLAAEAQFQKSMVYMDTREYPLAAVEFQILRKDFPTSDRVEDAFFQEGVAYFRQVDKIQRDVTGAHEARLHFLKFSEEFPGSVHLAAVREYMQQISDLMVRKRLQQAKVFWQLKRYAAVKVSLETVLQEEPGSTLRDQVLWQLGRASRKLDEPEQAARMYQRLLDEYPRSPLADRAREALGVLQEDSEADAPPES